MPITTNKDACELLDADHIAVKHLFVEYARLAMAAAQESTTERVQLASRICEELTVHAQIEEEIFYPALRQAAPKAGALLDQAQSEHQEAKALIARIQSLGSASAEMDDLVSRLAWAVEQHVKEERDELFPRAKTAKKLDLAALGDQLRTRQQELQANATV